MSRLISGRHYNRNKSHAIALSFTYVGQYGVFQESDNLYYMRARYYDATVGRFISEDPTGFDGGDVNLYAYVQNNPVNEIDPNGQFSISTGFEGAVTIFGFGEVGGVYGNFAHDDSKPWTSGWSSSVTFTLGGGAAAGLGISAGVNFNGSNANNVSDLEGTFYTAGRAGIGAISVGTYITPDQQVKGGTLTVGPSIGYTGAVVGGSYTWSLGSGNWYNFNSNKCSK